MIKKNSLGISVFGFENKKKHPIYVSKQRCGEKHLDFLLKLETETNTMFLSNILIYSCMKTHYIVEET